MGEEEEEYVVNECLFLRILGRTPKVLRLLIRNDFASLQIKMRTTSGNAKRLLLLSVDLGRDVNLWQ